MKHNLEDVSGHPFSDPDGSAIKHSDWLTTNQVGRMLQISPSSLEKARSTVDRRAILLP